MEKQKVIKKRTFGGTPAIDFLDLSYFMPIMTAAALKDSPKYPFTFGGSLRMAADVSYPAGRLLRWYVYEKFLRTLMATSHEAEGVNSERFARWAVSQYEGRRYPFIVIGPTLGSLVYLASALDAPFLPMNYSLAIRHEHINPDNSTEHIEIAKKRAEYFLKSDENIQIIHEYDPVHQRFRVKNGTLLRFRMMKLPDAYKRFIKMHLAQNGTIVFVESRIGWRQYRLADRLYHQVGRPGGIPCDEYLTGSKRLELFREKFLLDKATYRLRLKDEILPEACYGMTPVNRIDVIQTAAAERRNLCQLYTDDIYQINKLVSRLFLLCARREGNRPRYCFVQSGLFLSPYWCINSMVIPVWVPTPCFPALQFVTDFLSSYQLELEEVLLAFEPSVEEAPDYMNLDRWKDALEHKESKIRYIGMNPKRYPKELGSFFKYWPELSRWASRRRQKLDMRLSIDNIIKEAEACNISFQFTENK
jgi:hypothetical protein